MRPSVIVLLMLLGATHDIRAQTDSLLFAVEFRTGPSWDHAKPAHEQNHFKDHSANLKKLRTEGKIVVGARYGDVGFVVFSGTSVDEVRAWIDADPSVANGIFVYNIHPLYVFYPGYLKQPAPKKSSSGP